VCSISLYSLIVKKVQTKDHAYAFNVTLVVLLTEILKLLFSIFMFQFSAQHQQQQRNAATATSATAGSTVVHHHAHHHGHQLAHHNHHNSSAATYTMLFAVPALLYTIRNNMQFLNLSRMDFEAYKLLSNGQFIISGLLAFVLLKQKLSAAQWSALVLITFSCILIDFDPALQYSITFVNSCLLLIQVVSASVASLLVEMILKANYELNIDYLNMYLYTYSVIFNLIFLSGNLVETSTNELGPNGSRINVVYKAIIDITNPIVLILSIIGAIGGIITNRVLKTMGATTKMFAMACEMIITSFVATWLFELEFSVIFAVTLFLMVVSVVLYNVEHKSKDEIDTLPLEKATIHHME